MLHHVSCTFLIYSFVWKYFARSKYLLILPHTRPAEQACPVKGVFRCDDHTDRLLIARDRFVHATSFDWDLFVNHAPSAAASATAIGVAGVVATGSANAATGTDTATAGYGADSGTFAVTASGTSASKLRPDSSHSFAVHEPIANVQRMHSRRATEHGMGVSAVTELTTASRVSSSVEQTQPPQPHRQWASFRVVRAIRAGDEIVADFGHWHSSLSSDQSSSSSAPSSSATLKKSASKKSTAKKSTSKKSASKKSAAKNLGASPSGAGEPMRFACGKLPARTAARALCERRMTRAQSVLLPHAHRGVRLQ